MKLSRTITLKINVILDNLCPPIIRECRWLIKFLMCLGIDKTSVNIFMNFKKRLPYLNDEQIRECYEKTSNVIERGTDLTKASIAYIMETLKNYKKDISLLDVSCGRGYMGKKYADLLTEGGYVTGVDIYLPENLPTAPNLKYVKGSVSELPFKDNSFDCVISTHTLEHAIDIKKAIRELRRVCKDKLIIVVPIQREYRYTYDLHVHFFPYPESFHRVMCNTKAKCFELGGEIVYVESKDDINKPL